MCMQLFTSQNIVIKYYIRPEAAKSKESGGDFISSHTTMGAQLGNEETCHDLA